MKTLRWQDIPWESVTGVAPTYRVRVDKSQWRDLFLQCREARGRLIALWATDDRPEQAQFLVHAVLLFPDHWLWLSYGMEENKPNYPDVSDIFPAASRPQRAIYDLLGASSGAPDTRPWFRHGAWLAHEFPLRRDFTVSAATPGGNEESYAFVRVKGSGIHEMGVGPVHAGTIEPGHFRLAIVGDEIIRLEERLAYTHKGIEKRFESLGLIEGARLAGRVCADSTVAYTWAYAMAVEALGACMVPPRAQWLRGLLLERERIANHLGNIGALSVDGGLAFGQTQFSLLKERWIQTHQRLWGHRYLMDAIVPGGVAHDLTQQGRVEMQQECNDLEQAVRVLQDILADHAGLQERLLGIGCLTAAHIEALGGVGLAARASGLGRDIRTEFPSPPYDVLAPRMATQRQGDVAARMALRFDEISESLRLMRHILTDLPVGPLISAPPTATGKQGLGCVEGWRGEVFVAIERAAPDCLHHVHIHDPSWQNWPLLEHAVIGNLVPDFPLINASFNLAYSGHDL